jgi:hypothetical protein
MSDYAFVQSTGTIVPDTSTLLTEVSDEYKSAFGSDLVTTPDTPQGVLIAAETAARDGMVRNNAELANQINPNLGGGIFLDAICALSGLERIAATRSTVTGSLTGVAATLIPEGTRAQTGAGDVFETTGDVTLDGSGLGSVVFQSVETGPIPASIGELDQIVDGVIGWETVTNAAAATLGAAEESDAALRSRRRATLALQGIALPEAITSALMDTDGVKSLSFRENIASTTKTIDTIIMAPNSIFVCIDGGTDSDVAEVLLRNKSAGADWNGTTTVTVTEPFSGQDYDVKFQRPDDVPIWVRATVRPSAALSNPETTVKEAILEYVNGELSDEPGFVVGGEVSPFELAGAVNRIQPSIYVQKMEVSLDGVSYVTTSLPIEIDEIATLTEAHISVVIV